MSQIKSEASKTPKSESGQNFDFSTEEGLRKVVECPICLEIPLPPIYLCYNGHIICGGCQKRTEICPLCRSEYGSTRSLFVESLVDNCTLQCRYGDQGCQMSCKGSDMKEHLKKCGFHPIKCEDCNGKWIDFPKYHSHLMDYHKINGVNSSEGFVVYNMNNDTLRTIDIHERFCWPQYYFKAFEKTFLLRVYATEWFVCSWVALLGSKEDCEKYQAEMKLHLPSDMADMTSFSGKVNHYQDDPLLGVALNGRGLVTLLKTMQDYAAVSQGVAEWMYHVKITELRTVGTPTDPNASSTSVESGPDAVNEPMDQTVNETVPVGEQTGENNTNSNISSANHPTANTHHLTSLGLANSFDSAMLRAYNTRHNNLLDPTNNMANILHSD